MKIENSRGRARMKSQEKESASPHESEEQKALFQWAEFQRGRCPEISLLHHIPNGGSRKKMEAAHLRAQGVKSGVPDICLPVPRGKYHGMYIELKRCNGGKISDNQAAWLSALSKQGYFAVICKGWREAAENIEKYLSQSVKGR